METLTIGQLAKAAAVPVSTVRFYERNGLFKPDFRTGGNYRGYNVASLQRLRFIRSAQTTGFRLADIRELLNLTSSDESPCDDIETLLKRRLIEVRQRITELRNVEKKLAQAIKDCCRGTDTDLCDEISRLRNGKPCRESCDCKISSQSA
jgi:DNA-binding transcriptional MerR regulator